EAYGLGPLMRAAHRFTNRVFVEVRPRSASEAEVRLKARGSEDLQQVAAELMNEALDQTLRARLAQSTEPIRRLILAQAFSGSNLIHPELDDADPASDPAGIARPDDPHP